ncbi:DNA polymerase III subunit delta' [Mycoplasmatota bacterium]|nr:DNA polymerase III subunit delta' [Mycoplasmatota bacterium]
MILAKYNQIQPNVVKILTNSFRSNRFSHAHLFEGPRGTNKFDIAIDVAKMLICESACGECKICSSIDLRSHPNVIVIEPDGLSIKKEQIRNLITELNKTSLVIGPKVYIINHIDKMTTSAANSLLKYFEEPHDNTYAILITENIQTILPTIISRAQVITFNKVSSSIIREELVKRGINLEYSRILPLVTNNLEEAMDLANSEELNKMMDVIYELGNIYANKYHNALIYFHENGKFVDKNNVGLFLDLLLYYYKDILNYKTNVELVFPDNKALITLREITLKKVVENIEFIMDEKNKLKYNANVPLLLDRIILKLDWR